jgi:hypothetical protein
MQTIVEVVGTRDGGEHGLDFRGLVAAGVRVGREIIRLPDGRGHGREYRSAPTWPASCTVRAS